MDFSLEALEYYRLKDLLGRYVSTEAGRFALDDLAPIADGQKLAAEHAITAEAMSRLRIRAVSARQRVSELSGGNQQKVALAKALAAEPRILILLEPTRGIDIGAKVEIYETLGRLAAQKRAILMISSDLDELRHVADRLLIFYRGRIQGELSRAEATAEAVTLLATGQPLEAAG